MTRAGPRGRGLNPVVARVLVVVGILLQVVVLLPLSLVIGLVVPSWLIPGFVAMAIGFLVAAVRLRRRPLVVFAIPFVNLAVVLVVVTLGDVFLGWTA